MDATLRAMRRNGCTLAEVATALGMSKTAIENRCDALGLPTGRQQRQPELPDDDDQVEAREDTALPPGHPASWGAISAEPWPTP